MYFIRNGLYDLSSETWAISDDDTRQKMSVMATAAAWGLGQWDTMEEYVRCIPKGSFDEPFYQALLHIHNHQFLLAEDVRIYNCTVVLHVYMCVCVWCVCVCVCVVCMCVCVWCVVCMCVCVCVYVCVTVRYL